MQVGKAKTVIAVGDGMADEPLVELGGRTPLEAAHTPHLDELARRGRVGLLRTVPVGMPPGSDVANLSLLGYSPLDHYTGRAPLEAVSMGIRMEPGDVAFRCNLVTLTGEDDGAVMGDYSGGGIGTSRAREVIEALNRRLAGPDLRFHPGIAYRHVLILKGAGDRFAGLETTPPHDITGKAVAAYLPRGSAAEEIRGLQQASRGLLSTLVATRSDGGGWGSANAIWLWGQGMAPLLPSIRERFGVRGATVCAVDLIKGIGRCAGMTTVDVPGATGDLETNYQGKAWAALQALRDHDFVFVHVEAPDEAGHQGSLREKVRAIERFDAEVVGLLRRGLERFGCGYRLLVLPDHPTPVRLRTHSSEPVPFVLFSSAAELPGEHLLGDSRTRAGAYCEREARRTGVLLEDGHRILEVLFSPGRP